MFTCDPLCVIVGVTNVHVPLVFRTVFWQVEVPAVIFEGGGHVEVFRAVAGGGDRGRHHLRRIFKLDVPPVCHARTTGKDTFWLQGFFLSQNWANFAKRVLGLVCDVWKPVSRVEEQDLHN